MTAVLENYYHCLQNISLAAPSVWPTLRTIIQFVWKLERPPTINITIDVSYTVLTVLLCSLFHSLFIFFSNFTCSFMWTKISLQKFFATVEYWNIIHFVFVLWFIFVGKQICKIVFQTKIRARPSFHDSHPQRLREQIPERPRCCDGLSDSVYPSTIARVLVAASLLSIIVCIQQAAVMPRIVTTSRLCHIHFHS